MEQELTQPWTPEAEGNHDNTGATEPHQQLESDGFGFQCRLASSKVLVDGLTALYSGKKEQIASFTVNHTGIRVSVENGAKTMHAVMYMRANTFDDFEPPTRNNGRQNKEDDNNEEEDETHPVICFTVNLGNLLECLRVFGSTVADVTTVELKFHELTGDLLVVLEESGSITECQLRTGAADEELDFPVKFREYNTDAKVVFKSEPLRTYFSELVDTIGGQVRVRLLQQHPFVQLTLAGDLVSLDLEIPHTSDAVLTYDVSSNTEQYYDTKSMTELLRPVSMATETYMRINSNGMLAVNHKLGTESTKQCYVAFILLCAEKQ